ncbi:hypothetical protein [Nocardia miyunensis]|uniref:hypothetical protein n=1 Tax=Nocardia miyunensis TaxID=282684 RepID=UPI00082994F5|nr:hypothetical protein [Nocardia miyunensis]
MTDISDHLDALHADPSPVARIVSRLLDDVTGRNGWDGEWEAMDSDTQAEILTDWQQIVNDVLAEADTTVSPTGMVRVYVHPSGGDRERMAAEVRTVIAALTQAFVPAAESNPS